MVFAPSCRAWGNVPSERQRHSVRRLTPMRSSTSGTRNMASPETRGDISALCTVAADRASMTAGPTRLVRRRAQHGERGGVAVNQAAVAGPGQGGQRHSDSVGACTARGTAHHRPEDRTACHRPQSYDRPTNAHERSRTLRARGGSPGAHDSAHHGQVATPVTPTPGNNLEAGGPALEPRIPTADKAASSCNESSSRNQRPRRCTDRSGRVLDECAGWRC